MKLFTSISIVLFILCVVMSCGKDEDIFKDCVDSYFLKNPTLVKYNNHELLTTCDLFVNSVEIDNNLYFYNDSYCTDMILKLIDCNGNEASEEVYDCFHNNYESIKIIGIYL